MNKVLTEIVETLGVVNFSSHKQMKEAIEGAMALAETELERIKNEPTPSEQIRKIWSTDSPPIVDELEGVEENKK